MNKFGDEIIHGKKLDDYLETIWYPEFFVSNAENPRTLHYKTLDVYKGKFELFERFDVDLSIDAEMPRYPFGDLDLFLDIASFSGNKDKMVFYPETIEIGHHDAHHKIVKGNWKVTKTYLEEQGRTSLNHGGKEKFSYLISHVNVEHGFIDSLQKIIFPLLAIVILSLLINHFYIAGDYDRWNWRVGGQLTLFLTIPALKFAFGITISSSIVKVTVPKNSLLCFEFLKCAIYSGLVVITGDTPYDISPVNDPVSLFKNIVSSKNFSSNTL